jgi:hypothetical protein
MSDDEIQPFAGWDENGVWIVAGIDQYGNIVPLPEAEAQEEATL